MSSNNKFGTIIQIGDILVSEDVVTEYFACDYAVCKGCCCIIGDSGAPLEESELEPLEENYPIYSKLMRPQGREQIDKEGFFSIDRDGDIVTPVVDQTEECAYTTFDEAGNCFCSIERCFFQGEGIRVYQFLRDPLISVFGQDFYDALSYAAKKILDEA